MNLFMITAKKNFLEEIMNKKTKMGESQPESTTGVGAQMKISKKTGSAKNETPAATTKKSAFKMNAAKN